MGDIGEVTASVARQIGKLENYVRSVYMENLDVIKLVGITPQYISTNDGVDGRYWPYCGWMIDMDAGGGAQNLGCAFLVKTAATYKLKLHAVDIYAVGTGTWSFNLQVLQHSNNFSTPLCGPEVLSISKSGGYTYGLSSAFVVPADEILWALWGVGSSQHDNINFLGAELVKQS